MPHVQSITTVMVTGAIMMLRECTITRFLRKQKINIEFNRSKIDCSGSSTSPNIIDKSFLGKPRVSYYANHCTLR